MKHTLALSAVVAAMLSQVSADLAAQRQPPPLAVVIQEYSGASDAPAVHFLAGDYGFLANCEEGKLPEFYVYDKPRHRIVCVSDFSEFIDELEKIPDGATVDRKERCAPPFWHALPLDQRDRIMSLLTRKHCRLTTAEEGNFTICVCKGADADGTPTLRLLKRAR